MSNKAVMIINGSFQYEEMFKKNKWSLVNDILLADLIVFTGGSDVSSELYGEKAHPRSNFLPSRDIQERKLFNEALEFDIPMVGICRGGQFLNVMNGGKLYQHVTEHTSSHDMTVLATSESIRVTSTHHQMMIPGPCSEILAVASKGGYKEYMDGNTVTRINDELLDTEVVYYPNTACLCFQPHPEIVGSNSRMTKYFFELVESLLVSEPA